MGSSFSLKFWGTRGLISSPRANTAIYGGNTPAIQVLYKDHLILVDTGFGVSNLGEVLMDRILKNKEELQVHIFYTHFHWDHIQGLPFFHPIYFKSTTLKLYSPVPKDETFANLDLLFDGSYSPFSGIASMPSNIECVQVQKPILIDGLKISHANLDHQGIDTFAYRFDCAEGSMAIVTDHEARASDTNTALVDFVRGVDLLVHDGQYADSEYPTKVDWGHSTPRMALQNAVDAKAGNCLITHHDPARDDTDIQNVQKQLHRDAKFHGMHFEFAREEVIYAVKAQVNKTNKAS